MNISRKSWHYRLHVFVFTVCNVERYGPLSYLRGSRWEHKPKNLCQYFWSTFLLMVFIPVILLGLGLFFLVIFCLVWPIMWLHDKYREVRPGTGEPSLVRSYLAARKAKVCPLITVVD